jgi:ADP-heptose:LPS heptosyltransferase
MALREPPRRVQVLRALQLGDLLVAVPAFRALRRAWPDARIELIGLPWARALLERLPGYLDDVVEFPGWPGVPERDVDPARVAAFLAEAIASPADVAIQLHGSGAVTNPFVALLGARRTAGRTVPGAFTPDPELFVPYDAAVSEREALLSVLEPLGVDPAGDRLELGVLDRDRRELGEVAAGRLPPGRYAVVHPGSSTTSRRWPSEGFAVVADALAEHLPVVLTGTDREHDVVDATARAMRRPAIDLAGRTSLGALVALVDGAAVVVTNDTGVAHVADAVRTPSVVVFTVSDPAKWGPADRDLHRVVTGGPDGPASVNDVRRNALELLGIRVGARA